MALEKGLKIGPYEILAPLGAGGMGEVYRARDERLGRDVAVKVLPAEFADHPERVRRFEQEARAVAALNHPNILSIYDVGEHESAPYLVTELLEGESLREMLVEGPIPVRRAIDIGSQVAEGLAAAHEKGIVHRDLKPGNVFVTKEGRVKILDFGLARLVKGEGDSTPDSRAPTADPGTKPGILLGTMGYMSPEQVKGRPADARSDIFSLGVMLHEMLTGERDFKGDSDAEIMTAILKEDPAPLSELDLKVPPVLERTIVHCLEKNPGRRFQSARDIGFALESATSSSSVSVALPPLPEEVRNRRLKIMAGLAAATCLLVGLLSAGLLWGKYEYEKPAPSFNRVTFRRGSAGSARFTPDFQSVVYSAYWEGGEPDEIYVQRLASPDARSLGVRGRVVGTAGGSAFFLHDSTLSQIPLEGGVARDLLKNVDGADSGPAGIRFAVVRLDWERRDRNVFMRLEYPIGKVLVEATGQQGLEAPRISPDGKRVAYVWRDNFTKVPGDIRVVDTDGETRTLIRGWVNPGSLSWSPDGGEIWFTGSKTSNSPELHAVSLSGRERLVARLPGRVRLRDIASDGRVLITVGRERWEMRGRMAGDEVERDYSWLDGTATPILSSDGTQMVFDECLEGGGAGESVYHWRTGDPAPKKLASGAPFDVSPDWTRVLMFTGDQSQPRLKIVHINAGETRELAPGDLTNFVHGLWHPDGKRIVFVGGDARVKRALYVQDIAGGLPRLLAEGGLPFTFTPDRRYVLALPKAYGASVCFAMDGSGRKPVPFLKSNEWPLTFSEDGKSLFVWRIVPDECVFNVLKLDLKTGRRRPWLELRPPDRAGAHLVNGGSAVRITPNGRFYQYSYARTLQDIYLVEGLK